MPYNNGVIIINRYSYEKALNYFDILINRVNDMPQDAKGWSGNQWAVRDFLGVHKAGENVVCKELKFHIFPCSQYNYTPEKPNEDLSDKYLLHFRGEAKNLFLPYAQYLGLIPTL